MTPPRALGVLCQFWGLSPAQQATWWTALAQARWTVAVQWRERVRAADAPCSPGLGGPPPPLARTPLPQARVLVHQQCAPAIIMDVLEALVGEGALTRSCASALEEHILRAVNAQGQWGDHQQPVQAQR